jgi:catechol 2,3-dioxygenase-like lactoylglutathione lyase family enzyme
VILVFWHDTLLPLEAGVRAEAIQEVRELDGKIELILLPVADVDRAKEFYVERCGFELIVDHSPSPTFRIVQCQPRGSSCAVGFGVGIRLDAEPGSVSGMHLMVTDIVGAREELVERGVDVDSIVNFGADGVAHEGPHPDRSDYSSFAAFRDPDGNGWLLQERGHRPPAGDPPS